MNLVTTRTAAAMLDMTTEAIRYHEREGHLLAIKIERTPGQFQRLFLKEDIERFQRERARRALKRTSTVTVEVAAVVDEP